MGIIGDGEPGVVRIGPREIYDEVVGMRTDVQSLASTVQQLVAEVQDHELQLRDLQRGRWPLPSLAVVISAAALAAPFIGR